MDNSFKMINFKEMQELMNEQKQQISKIRKLLDDLEDNQRVLSEKMDKIQYSFLYDDEQENENSQSDSESEDESSSGSNSIMFDENDDEIDYQNMNISENLYVALGLSQIEIKRNSNTEEQEWRPPKRSGLNNSMRLV